MLYRVLNRPLEFSHDNIVPVGDLISTHGVSLSAKSLQALEKCGAIARVAAPPIAALPEWSKYVDLLAEADITDGEQFLEANNAFLQDKLGIDGSQVRLLKSSMLSILTTPRKSSDG